MRWRWRCEIAIPRHTHPRPQCPGRLCPRLSLSLFSPPRDEFLDRPEQPSDQAIEFGGINGWLRSLDLHLDTLSCDSQRSDGRLSGSPRTFRYPSLLSKWQHVKDSLKTDATRYSVVVLRVIPVISIRGDDRSARSNRHGGRCYSGAHNL